MVTQQPTPPTQDEFSDHADYLDSEDPMEKDEAEGELEKLVFGDNSGFIEGLKSYRQELAGPLFEQLEGSKDGNHGVWEDEGLEGIADADVISSFSTTDWNVIVADALTSSSFLTPDHLVARLVRMVFPYNIRTRMKIHPAEATRQHG